MVLSFFSKYHFYKDMYETCLNVLILLFFCCSDCLAPCLIAYWKHGSWLDAISCPLCRQKVQQARARQSRIKKSVSDLSVSRKWDCSWCSRSVRCVICSPRVGPTVSRKKCWKKSQTTTNVIQVPHEGWVLHKMKDQIFIFIIFIRKKKKNSPIFENIPKTVPPKLVSQFVLYQSIYNLTIFLVATVVNQKNKCYNEQFPRHVFHKHEK